MRQAIQRSPAASRPPGNGHYLHQVWKQTPNDDVRCPIASRNLPQAQSLPDPMQTQPSRTAADADGADDESALPAQRPRTQLATPATPVSHRRDDDDLGGQVVRSPEAALHDYQPPLEEAPGQDPAVVFEPLIKQVQAISVQSVQTPLGPSNGPNFKAFRKVWPQGHSAVRPQIGYAPAAYSDTAVDAEAFLRSEQDRRSNNRAADELFNARLASRRPTAASRGGARGRAPRA
ncbi:hypothetical protein WJX84_011261 [Apatococcus fuscideae]|uniref:Uncharacterized protein n=1 Tax=Apatococcus fuscideae TaxID=2026836 RepID=A0AAW1T9S0_9CHLO